MRLVAPEAAKHPRASRQAIKGFRPGTAPRALVAAMTRLERMRAQDVSAALQRLPVGIAPVLSHKKVVVIGCGSLGAGVARLLVQSAVGELTLIDPDDLAWENITRHELGADHVGENKALALAVKLRRAIPSVQSIEAFDDDWRAVRDINDRLARADLILSLTADWNSEVCLADRLAVRPQFGPVLFGWLEPNAAAAHALLLAAGAPCFRCGFDPVGNLGLAATHWPDLSAPEQCAGVTSPYGATDLAPAQAMVAELAMDYLMGQAMPPVRRTWLAPKTRLEAAGGSWSLAWAHRFGAQGDGAKLVAAPWGSAEGCACRDG